MTVSHFQGCGSVVPYRGITDVSGLLGGQYGQGSCHTGTETGRHCSGAYRSSLEIFCLCLYLFLFLHCSLSACFSVSVCVCVSLSPSLSLSLSLSLSHTHTHTHTHTHALTYWVLLCLSSGTALLKTEEADLCLNLYPCVIKYYLILSVWMLREQIVHWSLLSFLVMMKLHSDLS